MLRDLGGEAIDLAVVLDAAPLDVPLLGFHRQLGVLDAPVEPLEGGGAAGEADADAGRRGVEQVDRLVGELAAGDEALGEAHGGEHGGVEDAHAVGLLELLLDAAQHGGCLLLGRLLDLDELEAAGEGGVLLEVLLVLGPGGGGDGPQLAAGEGGLEQVGGVALPGRAAGADQGVRLVDEGDDRRRATP